jgi:hypothetical protein
LQGKASLTTWDGGVRHLASDENFIRLIRLIDSAMFGAGSVIRYWRVHTTMHARMTGVDAALG